MNSSDVQRRKRVKTVLCDLNPSILFFFFKYCEPALFSNLKQSEGCYYMYAATSNPNDFEIVFPCVKGSNVVSI